MAPKFSLCLRLHKLWMDRLENCCEYCGEMYHYDNTTQQQHLNYQKRSVQGHQTGRPEGRVKQKDYHRQHLEEFNQIQVPQQRQQENQQSQASIQPSIKNPNPDQRIWKPWQQQNLHEDRRHKRRQQISERLTLISSPKPYYRKPQFIEAVPCQPVNIQLAYDVTNKDDDNDDEIRDLLDDLHDAFKLQHRIANEKAAKKILQEDGNK